MRERPFSKIHFRKIDGRDTRTSNFPAYIEVRENCEFRSSASRYFIKWIFYSYLGLLLSSSSITGITSFTFETTVKILRCCSLAKP